MAITFCNLFIIVVFLKGNDDFVPKITLAIFCISAFSISNLFLLFNHWKYSREMELTIKDDQISIHCKDKAINFSINDIIEITLHNPGMKSLWHEYFYWEIRTPNNTTIISSVLSESKFDNHFKTDKIKKYIFYPEIQSD